MAFKRFILSIFAWLVVATIGWQLGKGLFLILPLDFHMVFLSVVGSSIGVVTAITFLSFRKIEELRAYRNLDAVRRERLRRKLIQRKKTNFFKWVSCLVLSSSVVVVGQFMKTATAQTFLSFLVKFGYALLVLALILLVLSVIEWITLSKLATNLSIQQEEQEEHDALLNKIRA